MNFQQFRTIVRQDLGAEFGSDLEPGFKDHSADQGSAAQGYSFQCPGVTRWYAWDPMLEKPWGYGDIQSWGHGKNLTEAQADCEDYEQ